VQFPQKNLLDVTAENIERTFKVNVFGYIFMAKAALPYLQEGATIINTSSVTCYLGHEELLDYSATKGAIVAFTRSLSLSLAPKKIRVNAVAPRPIWSPLTLSTMSERGFSEIWCYYTNETARTSI
jgi:NAD(P)-dependent dehydrogenase (short-subunit alcohol dehydrogenase family)